MLLGSVIALAIPLTHPLVALFAITVAIIFKLSVAAKVQFTSNWIKASKIIYVLFHLFLNIVLLLIYFANSNRKLLETDAYIWLGWGAVGCIFACIIIDIGAVIISTFSELIRWIHQLKRMFHKKHSKLGDKIIPKRDNFLSSNSQMTMCLKRPQHKTMMSGNVVFFNEEETNE